MKLKTLLWVPGCLIFAGCGGGSGSTSNSTDTGPVKTLINGPVEAQVVGVVATPVSVAGSNSAFTALFGADFTNVSVNPPNVSTLNDASLDLQTEIGLSVNDRPAMYDVASGRIFRADTSAGDFTTDCYTSFSYPGTQVVSSQFGSGFSQIVISNLDGSGRTTLTTSAVNKGFPTMAPNGTIAYQYGGDVHTMSSTGTGDVALTATGDVYMPRFSPDGTKIGFLRFINSNYQFWEMNANGSNQHEVLPLPINGAWDYAPSGNEVALVYKAGTASYTIYRYTESTQVDSFAYNSAAPIDHLSYSPSGANIAFQRTANSGNDTLETISLADSQDHVLTALPVNAVLDDWGPIPRKKIFIAPTGSIMNTNAAGFIYGVSGDNFSALLAFDATTRNKVTVTMDQPGNGTPTNFMATINSADNLTMLRYVNAFAAPRITVIDPTVSSTFAQGAIVAFNAAAGRVQSVVTFTTSSAIARPTKVVKSDSVTYTGKFLGVFDADGNKIASNVSTVTFDPKDGHVLTTSGSTVK